MENTQDKPKMTYWVYCFGKPIASVRGGIGLSDSEVKRIAIENENRVPLSGLLFNYFCDLVNLGKIRTFKGGN